MSGHLNAAAQKPPWRGFRRQRCLPCRVEICRQRSPCASNPFTLTLRLLSNQAHLKHATSSDGFRVASTTPRATGKLRLSSSAASLILNEWRSLRASQSQPVGFAAAGKVSATLINYLLPARHKSAQAASVVFGLARQLFLALSSSSSSPVCLLHSVKLWPARWGERDLVTRAVEVALSNFTHPLQCVFCLLLHIARSCVLFGRRQQPTETCSCRLPHLGAHCLTSHWRKAEVAATSSDDKI